MSAQERDRRGDRRRAETWTCPTCRRGKIDGRRESREDGVVYCGVCGTVDARSTEGNRRAAALELRALCERIERELAAGLARLEANVEGLESSIAYGSERLDRHDSKLEDVRSSLYQVERKAEAAEYMADEAKREAERARESADRAGRGW